MNMNRPFTRLFALMLAVVLALGCIGVTASAAADTKEVTIYFYYHQDDYVEKTILVDANATHVDMKTMNQAAKEAGIASGMGTWYIHGSYNNKILASENSDAPGVVWADVQCLYPMGDDTTVRPSVATNKEIRVNFYYEGTNTPVPGLYTMTVNQKTVLVDVQEVADLALENDLVLISLYRQIQDDQITAYVRQRMVNNPNATKVVNIYYYQQPYADGDAPAASSTVVVPINTDMIDTSIMETKAPTGWALEVFNSRIQNDANGEPSVSAYGYADGWPVERYSYEMCLQVPAIPDKTDAVESRFTVMDGQSFELPEVYTPAGWTFTGWLYNGELLEAGIYDVDALIPATFDNINTTHYFQAQLKEVETWTVSVKIGSDSAKEVVYSATVQADKNKNPVLNDEMYDYIFSANGKEFVRSDYVSVPTGWSSVDSSRNIAYVRLVPKDEYSNKLSVSFYVEGNGYIVGSVNQITSFSYTDLKTDSTGSIRIPEVQAADGYEFKGWANERGQIVFAPGTNRVLISDIAHSYLQNDAYAHFYAVIEEEGKETKAVTFGFTKDAVVAPTVEVTVRLDEDVMQVNLNEIPEIKAVLDENGWIVSDSPVTVATEYVTVIYSEIPETKTVTFGFAKNIMDTPTNEVTVTLAKDTTEVNPAEVPEIKAVLDANGWTVNSKLTIASDYVTVIYSEIPEAELNVTLNLDTDKGTVIGLVTSNVCKPGDIIELPAVTAKDGYEFDCWTDSNGNEWEAGEYAVNMMFDFVQNPTGGSMEFTAAFKTAAPETKTVTFGFAKHIMDTPTDEVTVTLAKDTTEVNPVEVPEIKAVLDAKGWTANSKLTIASDYVTVIYSEIPEAELNVKLNLDTNKGTVIGLVSENVCKPGDTVELPAVTAKAGYEFDCWTDSNGNEWEAGEYAVNMMFDFSSNPTGGTMEFTATFKTVQVNGKLDVTLSLDTTKGNVIGLVSNASYQPDDVLELPSVTANTGYTFKGWIDGNGKLWAAGNVRANELFDFTAAPAGGAVTLTASFEYNAALNVTLSLDSTKGTVIGLVANASYQPSDVLELPSVTANAGYTFKGWSDGTKLWPAGNVNASDLFNFTANPAGGSVTLTASFDYDAQLTVNLVVNSTEGETTGLVMNFNAKPGGAFELPSVTPKTGYTFDCWVDENGNEFGAGTYYVDSIFSFTVNPAGGTKTYTAQFKPATVAYTRAIEVSVWNDGTSANLGKRTVYVADDALVVTAAQIDSILNDNETHTYGDQTIQYETITIWIKVDP